MSALTALGMMPSTAPLDDPALSAALLSVGGDVTGLWDMRADERRAWWSSLTAAQRRAVIAAYPGPGRKR